MNSENLKGEMRFSIAIFPILVIMWVYAFMGDYDSGTTLVVLVTFILYVAAFVFFSWLHWKRRR